MRWIPRWLGEIYSELYWSFARADRSNEFTIQQADEKLDISRDLLRVALFKLTRAEWMDRADRGVYRLRDPGEVFSAIAVEDLFDLKRTPQPFTDSTKRFCIRALSSLRERLRSLVLFGSVARGDWQKDSDIDLLLVVENLPKNPFERDSQILPSTRGLPRPISFVSYTPEELSQTPPLLLDVAVDGIVLYDTGFIQKKLRKVRKRLEELGARRVGEKEELTWILKEEVKLGEEIEI